MIHRKKLIEVALPLDAINKASAREKSIRHGHPSTLHLWWARRPLAAARAVIFAQMVDDPSAHPDLFPTEEAQAEERQRLFHIIEELVKWENTTNEAVLQQARDEIWRSWRRTCAENADHPRAQELFDPNKLPAFHDPFAGGGSLPLEAQRLGLESYASDLNPVAVLICKAMIEIPPKFANRPPVNPEAQQNMLGAQASRLPLSETTYTWRSRGYLPHFDKPGLVQSITFRLADSLPRAFLDHCEVELASLPDEQRQTEWEKRMASCLDRGEGECHLRDPRIAALVENALLHFDGERYRLLGWCIMPNHVHVMIQTISGYALDQVLHSWKSYTAKEANRILKRSAVFWQREYHDRFIRDEIHFETALRYIEGNPVKAGLVATAADWRWSSARKGREAGGTPALPAWRGAQGLAEDVCYYGKWMRDEAEKRIGHLYPKVEVTEEMAKERLDLRPYVGQKLTVIAWLWARTVPSPDPAMGGAHVPLIASYWLSKKKGKLAWIEPVVDKAERSWRFEVRTGTSSDSKAVDGGTKAGRGDFRCLLSNVPIPAGFIRDRGRQGEIDYRMIALVADAGRSRVYLPASALHEAAADVPTPSTALTTVLPNQALGFRVQNYGYTTHASLYTPRQLTALDTLASCVSVVRDRVQYDALAAGLDEGERLDRGGSGAKAYADAVAVLLGIAVSRRHDRWTAFTIWYTGGEKLQSIIRLSAVPMTWEFAEGNPFSSSTGNFLDGVGLTAKAIESLGQGTPGRAEQRDARAVAEDGAAVICTDPPYFDNVPYADLSDLFYVWLRRTLQPVLPQLMSTVLVPKADELVADPSRHGGREAAERFFLERMREVIAGLRARALPVIPVTIFYAFKQSESQEGDVVSTGWDTFLSALIESDFSVVGTWPVRTEQSGGLRNVGRNSLATSVVLVCRPRPADAPMTSRREFLTALKAELPAALAHLQKSNIAPVDLAQAAIGPGMAVYTRYARVLESDGSLLTVRTALALINQVLDEVLAEQEGDFDADSRWALAWFDHSGFAAGEYGVAETLSKAKNTSISGMVNAGILTSQGGKVRLLRPDELPESWDPTTDARLTVWEMVHHLIRVLEAGGESAAADLMAELGNQAEVARELAYRLYTLCERKKRASEALAYNGLVQSWPEIARLARGTPQATPVQTSLL